MLNSLKKSKISTKKGYEVG